jgi:hypothetical protein
MNTVERIKHHKQIENEKDRMKFRRSLNEKRKLERGERQGKPIVKNLRIESEARDDIELGIEEYYSSREP